MFKKNNYLIILLLVTGCFSKFTAQNSYFEWTNQIGGKSNERGTAIELDSFGNIYCTGTISDTTHFADSVFVTDFDNIFISKFFANGDLDWVRSCGGSLSDRGQDLKVDKNNNILVTGYFESTAIFGDTSVTSLGYEDIFIVKYNSQGDLLWLVHAGGVGRSEGLCIANDANNNIYVSGYFEETLSIGTFTLSAGNFSTIFLAKISENGNVLWAKQAVMQDFGESFTNDLICDSNGNIMVTGYFNDTFILPDTTFYSFDGSDDIFLIKYNTNGDVVWNLQVGGNYDDYGTGITVDELDNLYLIGQFRDTVTFGNYILNSQDNNTDIFYSKLNSQGDFQWVEQSTGIFTDRPTSIFYNQNYGLSICGSFIGDFNIGDSTFTNVGTEDVFLANFLNDGTFKSAISFGENAGDDIAYDVCVSDAQNAYMIGIFHNSLAFGNILLNSYGLADAFVTKVDLNLIDEVNTEDEMNISDYIIYQNYPNPFNPITKIRFTISDFGFVSLKVYDVLGNEVATLVNEKLSSGEYEVEFSTRSNSGLSGISDISSGIYFYQLRAGKFIETKKMILLK